MCIFRVLGNNREEAEKKNNMVGLASALDILDLDDFTGLDSTHADNPIIKG
jgi:hypothetical protein